jgi:hypothetical protein
MGNGEGNEGQSKTAQQGISQTSDKFKGHDLEERFAYVILLTYSVLAACLPLTYLYLFKEHTFSLTCTSTAGTRLNGCLPDSLMRLT